jgi:alkyldihydroxyacetonephosphate synthase
MNFLKNLGNNEEVEVLVKLANDYNVAIIPYGGGTSVTWALMCPKNEKRMIVSLDTSKLVHKRHNLIFLFVLKYNLKTFN